MELAYNLDVYRLAEKILFIQDASKFPDYVWNDFQECLEILLSDEEFSLLIEWLQTSTTLDICQTRQILEIQSRIVNSSFCTEVFAALEEYQRDSKTSWENVLVYEEEIDYAISESNRFLYKPSIEKLLGIVLFFSTVLGINRLSKTKLNKLAFFSDFLHCKRFGYPISGFNYVHLPHGPVIDNYESILRDFASREFIWLAKIRNGGQVWESVNSNNGIWRDILDEYEKETLQAVLERIGKMNAAEVSDLSHRETAWSETYNGEIIPYDYAHSLSTFDN